MSTPHSLRLTVAVAAALLVGSSARAAEPDATCPSRDVVITVDISYSLTQQEQREAIVSALDQFIDALGDQHHVALVTFGGYGQRPVDLGRLDQAQRELLKSKFRELRFTELWTDIKAGIDTAYNVVATRPGERPKVVFLLTDGAISLRGAGGKEDKDAAEASRKLIVESLAGHMKQFNVALWAIVYSMERDSYDFISQAATLTNGVYLREQAGVTKISNHVLKLAKDLCPIKRAPAPTSPPPRPPVPGPPGPTGPTGPSGPQPGSGSGGSSGGSSPTSTASSTPDATGPDLPLGSAMLLLLGLNAIAGIAALWFRRRPSPEPEVALAPVAPAIDAPKGVFAPKATGLIVNPCHVHPDAHATWTCGTCGNDFCETCVGRYRKPPCCDGCRANRDLDDDDLRDTQISVGAGPPLPPAPENMVFVAVFQKDRTLIRKAEMRADGTAFWLMGPSGLLAEREFTQNLGALRLDIIGDHAVVTMIEVPRGGFRDLDTGKAYDTGTRLQNNQRFVWAGDPDDRYFEVVFK